MPLLRQTSVSIEHDDTYPAKTPPARTRAMETTSLYQNSGEPGVSPGPSSAGSAGSKREKTVGTAREVRSRLKVRGRRDRRRAMVVVVVVSVERPSAASASAVQPPLVQKLQRHG